MASLPRAAQPILLPVAAGKTDVGRRREHNEDQILIADELGVYAVADGMGGHQAGDVASSVAAAAVEEFFWSEAEVDPEIADIDDLPEGARRLVAAIHHSNEEVFARSGRSANQGGMGSTVVAIYVCIEEQLVHIVHVGDSRCYRVRDGDIELLTEDHSMINEALRLNPDLSEDILRQLPTNVVTRALGTKESVRPDVRSEPLCDGDIYLLCSDGLSGEVSDDEMLAALLEAGDEIDRASELLVAMANQAGGRDNISALVVRITDAERLPDARKNLIVLQGRGRHLEDDEEPDIDVDDEDEDEDDEGDTADNPLEEEDEDVEVSVDSEPSPWSSEPSSRPPWSDGPEEGVSEPPDEGPLDAYQEVVELVARVHPPPADASVVATPVLGVGRMAPPPEEPRTRRCASCGHSMLPEERFCGMCGARSDEEDTARCDACGHEVLLGTTYCVECGVMHGY